MLQNSSNTVEFGIMSGSFFAVLLNSFLDGDGYHSDSYFSGVVIKYLYGEGVIVGRYWC